MGSCCKEVVHIGRICAQAMKMKKENDNLVIGSEQPENRFHPIKTVSGNTYATYAHS
jgi:hypothetical protein